MANNLAIMPYRIDTVMPNSLKNTAGAGFGNGMFISHVHWTNPGAAGAGTFVLQDNLGNTLLSLNAPAATLNADQDLLFSPPLPFSDFKCTTISGGGAVFIYTL